jgi:hypothetical protein
VLQRTRNSVITLYVVAEKNMRVGATGRTRSINVGVCVQYDIDIHIYMKGFNENLTSKLTNSIDHSPSLKASCLSSSQILHF